MPIKIGWTEHLERRMEELRRNSPFTIRLLARLNDKKRKEDELHKKFSAARIEGKKEWFWPVRELLDFINSLQPIDPKKA